MPKLYYNPDKGLRQISGDGVDLTHSDGNGTVAYRKKVVDATSSDVTLISSDSGAFVFMSASADTRTVKLPTAAAAGEGWEVSCYVAATGSNYVISGANGELQGHWLHGTRDTTVAYAPIKNANAIGWGSLNYSASHAPALGDRVDIHSDGTNMYVWVLARGSGSTFNNNETLTDLG